MVKQILPPEKCVKCKGCCYFDKSDIYEVPDILPELAKYIEENYKNIKLVKYGSIYRFEFPENLKEGDIFTCPMLAETGCVLRDDKPFDCRIYPFRIMNDKNGKCHVAVSDYCSGVKGISLSDMREFLLSSGLYTKIMEYKKLNPASVLEYTKEYKIVC